jgi:hypothetical protein
VAQATAAPGRVIVLSPSWEVAALQYYAPDLAPLGRGALIHELDLLTRRWSPSYSPTVQVFEPPPSLIEGETRTLQNFTLTVFRAPRPVSVRAAALSRVRPENASRVLLER